MSENKHDHLEQNYFILDNQEIKIDDFNASGLILDIGGGGEGIIGQLKGSQVVAIDPNRRELEETADGPLKIVMDAKELQFLDSSFEVVTSFFTLMYIKGEDQKKVFEEACRVLKPGGRFLIWDINIPLRTNEKEDLAVVMLKIILPDREIETGYGIKWPKSPKDLVYYKTLAAEAGFLINSLEEKGKTFYLELKKP